MSHRIAILGTGLMGGSLARALKSNHYPATISAYARSKRSLETCRTQGIYDLLTQQPEDAVKDADMVVLCTPLSSYAALVEAIAPHMKPGAVLTDVGSVKHAPAQEVLHHLTGEQKANFVPGHPIAGTEKSGPEAGFATLYDGKKVVLTPTAYTSDTALEKVRKLWEAVGADVVTMESTHHDFTYAMVSHSVQFLSYAFGVLVQAQPEAVRQTIKEANDRRFQAFIRLTGSDVAMWYDIFRANRVNVLQALAMFEENIRALADFIRQGDHTAFQHFIEKAETKRRMLEPSRQYTATEPVVVQSGAADILLNQMPYMMASALMEGLSDAELPFASSGGINGFTENLLTLTLPFDDMQRSHTILLVLISDVLTIIHRLQEQVMREPQEMLAEVLKPATEIYRTLYQKVK
ncbi:MAG: prephenate dehydrogenase/arogenate dehydrogenase family protein [Hyphomicrobiales bacterium]|nr:prephenate dehydrogenase/arogenate dehydrogenase family protein [Hyphomicrobiales bacterium]